MDLTIASADGFTIESAQSRWIPVRLQLSNKGAEPGSQTIRFKIDAPDRDKGNSEKPC